MRHATGTRSDVSMFDNWKERRLSVNTLRYGESKHGGASACREAGTIDLGF